MKNILRVGVMTNFNQTQQEDEYLKSWDQKFNIFVNTNSKTPLRTSRPAIVTVNSYLDKFDKPTDPTNIKACRIKVVFDPTPEVNLALVESMEYCITNNIPMLFTFMRFKAKESIKRYTTSQDQYHWEKSYYRPSNEARENFISQALLISSNLTFICDQKQTGCPDCRNCQKLTYPEADGAKIYSMDLQLSGPCKFNCPSCFAKNCISRAGNKISFNKPKLNTKLKGYNLKQ